MWNYGSGLGAETSLKDFRKDIIIEVYNEAGQLALAYKVYRCWVSEYQALPDLDANANAVAIQTHQARERGLGARLRRRRTHGAVVRRAVTADADPRRRGGRSWRRGRRPRPSRACAGGARCSHRAGLVADLAGAGPAAGRVTAAVARA